MTRRDSEARAAELAETPWLSPPASVSHPQAAWHSSERCDCKECVDGRKEARRHPRRSPSARPNRDRNHRPRASVATVALARSASRNAGLLARRLEDLAQALDRDDKNEISCLREALRPELERTRSLLENLDVDLACRGDR